MANYPIPDGTNNIEQVLFPSGVTSFNEDYQAIEDYNERESLYRFNSIVKTPGIVSKKATELLVDQTLRNLCPISTGVGNGIIITSGTGFTKNGARITIPLALTVTDITACTGYVDPATMLEGESLHIVLRKIEEDGYPRTHPINGTQHNTRRRIKYDNTVVEFIIQTDGAELSDNDVVVLGELLTVSPITFNLTESVGRRRILRLTEALTCETTGFTMEGDINMNLIWNILNVPQWGSAYWKANGVPHNSDFVRLFGRTNSVLTPIAGIRFTTQSGNYGLLSLDTGANTVKFSILGGYAPMRQIDIMALANEFKQIPVNNVLYYQASDYDMGLTSLTPGGSEIGSGTDSIGAQMASLQVAPFSSLNVGATGDIKKVPICWHYYYNGIRRLIFANGVQLIDGEEIRTDGRVSTWVRREGDTMFGDLRIIKDNARLYLRQVGAKGAARYSGVLFEDEIGVSTGGILRTDEYPLDSRVEGDVTLTTFNATGAIYKNFIFKRDGRLQITGDPTSANDVIRLGWATGSDGFVRKTGDTMSGKLIILNDFNVGSPTVEMAQKALGYVFGDFSVTADALDRGGKLTSYRDTYTGRNLYVGINEGGTYDGTSGNILAYGNIEFGQLYDDSPKQLIANGYINIATTDSATTDSAIPFPTIQANKFHIYTEAMPSNAGTYGPQLATKSNWGLGNTGVVGKNIERLINRISIKSTSGLTVTATSTLIGVGVTPLTSLVLDNQPAQKYLLIYNIDIENQVSGDRMLTFEVKDQSGSILATFYKHLTVAGGANPYDTISHTVALDKPSGVNPTFSLYVKSSGSNPSNAAILASSKLQLITLY